MHIAIHHIDKHSTEKNNNTLSSHTTLLALSPSEVAISFQPPSLPGLLPCTAPFAPKEEKLTTFPSQPCGSACPRAALATPPPPPRLTGSGSFMRVIHMCSTVSTVYVCSHHIIAEFLQPTTPSISRAVFLKTGACCARHLTWRHSPYSVGGSHETARGGFFFLLPRRITWMWRAESSSRQQGKGREVVECGCGGALFF